MDVPPLNQEPHGVVINCACHTSVAVVITDHAPGIKQVAMHTVPCSDCCRALLVPDVAWRQLAFAEFSPFRTIAHVN